MLILSRKRGEVIRINDDITVEVVDICRGKVRLGLVAPRNVPILRGELLEPKGDSPESEASRGE